MLVTALIFVGVSGKQFETAVFVVVGVDGIQETAPIVAGVGNK